ncbi:hypothetical protein C8R46DRAFT_462353 [Mycena filopes]|nr:hypothetical protein C8R46DRAFT_462353 [Mycena filopes]
MNVKISCDVCFESHSLELFRFLPACGHGLCVVCTEKTATKRNCAICRHPKGSQEPVQIYMNFSETTPARAVLENLTRIGPDSLPISVQKAGRKIRHALQDIESGDEVVRELLDAAKNLDERIAPLFVELDLAKEKMTAMTTEIEELRRKLQAAAARENEIKQLRRSLAMAESQCKNAVGVAEQATDSLLKERADNARLGRTIQRHLIDLHAKEQENELLRAKLARRDNRISLLEKKIKVVSRTVKHPPKADPDNADESLQIDNSIQIQRGYVQAERGPGYVQGPRIIRKPTDWPNQRVAKWRTAANS